MATTRTVSSCPGSGMMGFWQTQQRGANFLQKESFFVIEDMNFIK
jgi:hypothetical protein